MAACGRRKLLISLLVVALPLFAISTAVEKKKASRLEGEYRIYLYGREIGVEKFLLTTSEGGAASSSTLDFRNPGQGPKKVFLETKLEMDAQYLPKSYELRSEVDGQKGTIRCDFAPNQAIFEYSSTDVSRRNGLLVGSRYTILDTNTFHHFIFLARLFKYDGGKTPQIFEVVIPQEKDIGTLKISELNKETLLVKGKKVTVTRLLLDSGSLQIQLWVDSGRIPRKIAVPEKGIEVLHGG
jgi:hypothetical protein